MFNSGGDRRESYVEEDNICRLRYYIVSREIGKLDDVFAEK